MNHEGKNPTMNKYTIKLASPRGFCAGVERAILIVEESLKKFGAPVYVRHEIVHNKHVVSRLQKMGAIFVEELEEIPATNQPVIFSAHGVPKSVPDNAKLRNLTYIDATCPLVSKVHREAEKQVKNGRIILLIGHKNHPEVIGTMGQVDKDKIFLVENITDIQNLNFPKDQELAYVTQTTLSVDETQEIIGYLIANFPNIHRPKQEDICYATTNRQAAVKAISKDCDLLLVVGSKNSSNSLRLLEVGLKFGAKNGYLINDFNDINQEWLSSNQTIAITAGASAPEDLVEGVLEFLASQGELDIEKVSLTTESVQFNLPRQLYT